MIGRGKACNRRAGWRVQGDGDTKRARLIRQAAVRREAALVATTELLRPGLAVGGKETMPAVVAITRFPTNKASRLPLPEMPLFEYAALSHSPPVPSNRPPGNSGRVSEGQGVASAPMASPV